MTVKIAPEFLNSDGSFDTEAAMQAGRKARADAFRDFVELYAMKLMSNLRQRVSMLSLTNPKTQPPVR